MSKRILITVPLIALLAASATALAQVTENASTTEPITESSTITAETVSTVSEPSATSTDVATTDNASTTPSETVATTDAAAFAPVTQATPAPTPTLATASGVQIAQEIAALEAAYFERGGKYLQILPNNQLPDYETGTVAEKLGATIRSDARVDVYESPRGNGYQIQFQDGNTFYSIGYGPEWAERTYSYAIPSVQASSTAPSMQ